ncbi:MAG: carboxy terminal-processing peptidase [Lentisphaerae bacterium]|nr:carboxy terminal-processing peptidase [Lentisphaerota bacterium]
MMIHDTPLALVRLLMLLPLAAGLSAAPSAAQTETAKPPVEAQPHFGNIARTVGWMLPNVHLLQVPLDDAVSARAWTNYLSFLDYDRAYFLQADIAEFEAERDRLDDAVRAGDLSFAYAVFARFKQRLAERLATVDTLLEAGFDFTVPESYQWKRKEAPWPATPGEQDDLWRRRIKNEYLGFQIAREYGESNRLARAQAATNSLALAAGATGVVDRAAAGVTNGLPAITPEAFVRKRYEQFRIVIEDSDADWVLERFLGALAAAYDPHTAYMPPAAVEDFTIDMNLSLSGIGALLSPEDGAAKIMEIIPGGPAARDTRESRLVPGDKIIGVGQDQAPVEDVLHLPLNKIVRKIRGKKGTRVVLQVISAADPSGGSTRIVDLIRDDVKLEEQAATGHVARVTLSNGTSRAFGVVKLPTFYGSMTSNPRDPGFRSCTVDLAAIIAAMNDDIEGLILDLRGNGGGSLREAVDLTGRFIRIGPVVQQREGRRLLVHTDRDPAVTFRKPMIVLVNRASASASEIVAAALQDYGRAVIIGDSRTHGKGSVQTIVPLSTSDPRMGSMKITVANYYRITGGSTQLRGVEPDLVIPSVLEHLDMGEDKLPNPMPWTRIPATEFSPVYDLAPLIPVLASNLQHRARDDARYQQHLREVEHVREASRRTTLPLDYATRFQLYAAEREIQRADADEGGGDAALDAVPERRRRQDTRDDVVLDQALRVLADLADLQQGVAIDPALDRNALDAQDWLRRIFQP